MELLISMTIGLVVLGGVATTFTAQEADKTLPRSRLVRCSKTCAERWT